MQTTIEIDGSLIPEGWEAVEFRWPNPSDEWVDSQGELCVNRNGATGPRLIVRPVWQWPDWIKPGS